MNRSSEYPGSALSQTMSLLTSLQRLLSLASTTFTQLVRMKVFLFLFFFIILFLGANTLRFNTILGPETAGEQELTLMKESTLGILRLFCLIFSISATALLLPKDSEDRILYTILCKPVPRWEYLTGKLLGVMALIMTVVLCMDVLFSLVLEWRTQTIIAEQTQIMLEAGYEQSRIDGTVSRIMAQGATWSLQMGIGSLLFESLLLCSVTLFLSVFSTSTIFSIIIAFCVYVIGLFQEELRSLWFQSIGSTVWDDISRFTLSILFPDFRIFALMDSAVSGKSIPVQLFIKIGLISLAYMTMYLTAATWIFKRKEF